MQRRELGLDLRFLYRVDLLVGCSEEGVVRLGVVGLKEGGGMKIQAEKSRVVEWKVGVGQYPCRARARRLRREVSLIHIGRV